MLLADQSRHEILYSISLYLLLSQSKQQSKVIVTLNYLAKFEAIGIYNDKIG